MILKAFPGLWKCRYALMSAFTIALVTIQANKAQASMIFPRGKCALKSIIDTASNSQNETLKKFPDFFFTVLDLLLVMILVASITQAVIAVRQGEEVASLVRTPVTILAGMFIIMIIQKVFLTSSATC